MALVFSVKKEIRLSSGSKNGGHWGEGLGRNKMKVIYIIKNEDEIKGGEERKKQF